MISHLSRTDIVDIFLPVLGQFYAFVNALLKLTLIKLHFVHIQFHSFLFFFYTFIVLLERGFLKASDLLHLLCLQKFLPDFRVHKFQPEHLCR
jgi:hypothetical protein